MKNWILATTVLALAAGAPLAAQEPHLGLAVNIAAPTGDFSSTNYGGGLTESYEATLGLQFTASFPVDKGLALRFNVGGQNFRGHVDQPGYDRYNVQDAMFSLGGEAQIFLAEGSALRHTGTYLIGGVSLDLERFTGSYDDPARYSDYYYDSGDAYYTSTNKSRLAVVAGLGHSFRYLGRSRWTLEAVYHKTLTGHDTNAGDPPPADFVKISLGMTF